MTHEPARGPVMEPLNISGKVNETVHLPRVVRVQPHTQQSHRHFHQIGSHVVVRGLCAVPWMNCTGRSSSLILSALRYAATIKPTVDSNSTLPTIRISTTTEANQHQRFSVSPIGGAGEPSNFSVCREKVLHLAHFVVGHFSLNLMHTMMRVISIQRGVMELQDYIRSECGSFSTRPKVAVLITPRKLANLNGELVGSLGFYKDLLPLVQHSTVEFWPTSGLCGTVPISCKSTVSLSHSFVRFYEPLELAPFTKESVSAIRAGAVRTWLTVQHSRPNKDRCRVVVINRQRTRRVRNVDDIVEAHNDLMNSTTVGASTVATLRPVEVAWKVVELEPLSPADQARVFSAADVLIAVHGAALTWSLMMDSRSSLLEMLPPAWTFLRKDISMFRIFTQVANVQEHFLFPLRLRSGSPVTDAFSRNFSIHPKDLRKIASWVSSRCEKIIR